jgi:quinolinate synthase
VSKRTGRDDLIVWQGACVVHEQFSAKGVAALKIQYPDADVLAHPECDQAVLDQADLVASTTGIIQRAIEAPDRPSIVATEEGVFHAIRQKAPEKLLIAAPGSDESCSCSQCPFMRLNTLEKLYLCMRDLGPEVTVAPKIAEAARKPIERMLELS